MDDTLTLVREFEITVGGKVKTMASLGYLTTDPFAVVLTVRGDKGPIMWTFARELLHGGGQGDVKVTHGLTVTSIELSNSRESAVLTFQKAEIDAFLRMVYTLVKDGEESRKIDWDTELARLID